MVVELDNLNKKSFSSDDDILRRTYPKHIFWANKTRFKRDLPICSPWTFRENHSPTSSIL